MSKAVPPIPQYAFMAWCSVKVQGNFTFIKWKCVLKVSLHDDV